MSVKLSLTSTCSHRLPRYKPLNLFRSWTLQDLDSFNYLYFSYLTFFILSAGFYLNWVFQSSLVTVICWKTKLSLGVTTGHHRRGRGQNIPGQVWKVNTWSWRTFLSLHLINNQQTTCQSHWLELLSVCSQVARTWHVCRGGRSHLTGEWHRHPWRPEIICRLSAR